MLLCRCKLYNNIVKLETLCNDYPAVHPFLQGTQTVEFIQVVVPKLTEVKGKGGGGNC